MSKAYIPNCRIQHPLASVPGADKNIMAFRVRLAGEILEGIFGFVYCGFVSPKIEITQKGGNIQS